MNHPIGSEFTATGPVIAASTISRASAIEQPIVSLQNIEKHYGQHNRALAGVDFAVRPGEIVGLIGANGAGKTTLLKVLTGITQPTSGTITLSGEPVTSDYNAATAWRAGISMVHQELSLCTNLSVWENWSLAFDVLGHDSRASRIRSATEALDRIFPGSEVPAHASVSQLTLAEQQMVEIARAASHPQLRLLVLDEPTSALSGDNASRLHQYLRDAAERGCGVIYVTHKLDEVLDVAGRIVVLRNGQVWWSGAAEGASREFLVDALGGRTTETKAVPRREGSSGAPARTVDAKLSSGPAAPRDSESAMREVADSVVELRDLSVGGLSHVSLHAGRGEMVGLAGLEGAGQRTILQAIFRGGQGARTDAVSVRGSVAYVTGDRQKEGVFPLWNVFNNIFIGALHQASTVGVIDWTRARELVRYWFDQLAIAAPDPSVSIGALSGGNQQKVLIARAFASDAQVLLLDDPTRGVDTGTKSAVYEALDRARSAGRTVFLYSTEDAEFRICDRVYTLVRGQVSGELTGADASVSEIVRLSYSSDLGPVDSAALRSGDSEPTSGPGSVEVQAAEVTGGASATRLAGVASTGSPRVLGRGLSGRTGRARVSSGMASSGAWIAWLLLLVVAVGTVAAEPRSASTLGVGLLLAAAIPLTFASLAQMMIILVGDFDLGVGYAVGLVNVLSAGLLVSEPLVGLLSLVLVVVGYLVIGAIVEFLDVPAIVVTLGASFIWLGIALVVSPAPGGEAPSWLAAVSNGTIGVVPNLVPILMLAGVVGWALLHRWRYGVVLRAIGNNRSAVHDLGRSVHIARLTAYALAGLFVLLAGLATTGLTASSDVNASGVITLNTFAVIVVGGCTFGSGFVQPVGVVAAAVALALLTSLLAFLQVSTVYNPLVVGAVLVAAMSARWITRRFTRYSWGS
jgi:ribose transport system ATP-binding protein